MSRSTANQAANQAVKNLSAWMWKQGVWRQAYEDTRSLHIDGVLEKFGLSQRQLMDEIGPAGEGTLFGCVFEDLAAQRLGGQSFNLVDDYLRRRGWNESGPGKQYLTAMRDAVMSLYEVVAVEPGEGIHIKDLLRGGRVTRVEERSGSRQMVQWDLMAVRVIQHLGRNVLTGVILMFPRREVDFLLKTLERLISEAFRLLGAPGKETSPRRSQRKERTDDALRECAPAFTNLWLAGRLRRNRAPRPEMVNFDGEAIVMAEVRFPLDPARRGQVQEALDRAPDLERNQGGEISWTWIGTGPSALPKAGRRSGRGLGFGSFARTDPDRPILGAVLMEEKYLLLSVNSQERMQRGCERLKTLLGKMVGAGLTTITPLAQALAERGSSPAGKRPAESLPPQVAREALHRFLDDFYRKWMSQKIPALGGKSPLQAARGKGSRGDLVELLKGLEHNEARRAMSEGRAPYDVTWIWEELGVLDLRR